MVPVHLLCGVDAGRLDLGQLGLCFRPGTWTPLREILSQGPFLIASSQAHDKAVLWVTMFPSHLANKVTNADSPEAFAVTVTWCQALEAMVTRTCAPSPP